MKKIKITDNVYYIVDEGNILTTCAVCSKIYKSYFLFEKFVLCKSCINEHLNNLRIEANQAKVN